MQLTGGLKPSTVELSNELFTACPRMESQMRELPDCLAKKCLVRLYNDLNAVTAGLANYVQVERASSQVTCAILRTLMESCISVFAFCKAPEDRAHLYWHYNAVLDWKFALMDERNRGCPWVPVDEDHTKRLSARKSGAREIMAQFGEPYVVAKKGRTPAEILRRALKEGSESCRCFRHTWYPEPRRDVLEREGMGWTYDVLYTRFCSCVHSDSGASKVFKVLPRDNVLNLALRWFGAAIFRILETFKIRVSAEHKQRFSFYYQSLRHPTTRPN